MDELGEFGGEDNALALSVLVDEVTDGEGIESPVVIEEEIIPTAEVAVEPEVPIDPTIPPPIDSQVDTQAILAQMQLQQENQNKMMETMQSQIAEQNQIPIPELTEEELAMEELKERMGLTALETQNKALQEQLSQQQEFAQHQEQKAYEAQINNDINSLKVELNGFDENLIVKELEVMSKQLLMLPNGQIARDENGNPINQAMMHDNKAGWAKIWSEKFADSVAPTPDPIVAAGHGQAVTQKDAMSRIKSATDTMSQGEALLDLIGG